MTTTLQDLDDPDRNKVENNGSNVVVIDNPVLDEAKSKGTGTADLVGSPPSVKSSPTAKGFGLKKWRRIRRQAHKDGDSNTESAKLLKRGLSNAAANPAKPVHLSAGTIRNSDGSVSSANAILRSPGVLVDGFGLIGDSGLAIQPIVFGGTNSENSEDRSSRSSTAASAPRARYEIPIVHGYVPVKNGQRTQSGNYMGTSAQQSHPRKGRAEASKKARGERVKLEKENSHSSLESDSQSSNFLRKQSNNHATSNGTKGGSSANNDGQFSDEALTRERPFSEELQTGLDRRNGKECETEEDQGAESTWEVKEERSEYQGLSTDHDPLLESMFTLQAAQENLEREIQKLKEIRIEDVVIDHSLQNVGIPSDFSSGDTDFPGPNASEHSQSRNGEQHSFDSLESEVVSLKQNSILLQNKLNDESDLIKLKEARVTELEALLCSNSKKEEKKTGNDLHQSIEDIEGELECLFRQKIEAEIEYLAISRTIQMLRTATIDQATLVEDQDLLATEQARMVKKLGDSEKKAAIVKSQVKNLEKYCDDVASTNKTLELQKGVCKYSSYFLIPLVLLAIVFGLYMLQISPDAVEVVPT
ncbi:WPP domain-interacting protein 1-like [Lycium barbarum]|uniref:WPP domain-interacting protein 1-like n=1 Tax=Lycium barbarum TaxID=112863 RepID=UPI00293E964F|nr:WPP domain-interacting protein 1-like [Lycium barbarum]XP_060199095.1 WPP domain-interacting protein 1-like [Lycium barbarum]